MGVELWEAGITAAGAAVAGVVGGGFWSRRSKGERAANSAVLLTKAYGELIDDQRASLTDARNHIQRLGDEVRELREELRALREAREQETAGLRAELAQARAESASLREELRLLRVTTASPTTIVDRRSAA